MKPESNWHSVELTKPSLCLLTVFLAWAGVVNSIFGKDKPRVVSNLNDGGSGSLREEIASARAGDTISFAVRGNIVLTNGQLLVTNNLRIAGPGAAYLAISARSQGRILEILPNAKIHLFGLTICDGHAPNGALGTSNNPTGGTGSDGGTTTCQSTANFVERTTQLPEGLTQRPELSKNFRKTFTNLAAHLMKGVVNLFGLLLGFVAGFAHSRREASGVCQ